MSDPSTPSKILIVDDTPTNLRLLFDHLKQNGFKVLVATSGEQALKQLTHIQPDLILLDVMMAEIDGFETCRRIKAQEATEDIPVIFMTALSDINSKLRGFEVGGVDFVTKPLEYQEVLARVTTHLTLRRLQKELEQKNAALQEALNNIKTLRGLLPICANCKKIRDDEGYWQDVAVYIRQHSEAEFTHGICPDCIKDLYPEFANKE